MFSECFSQDCKLSSYPLNKAFPLYKSFYFDVLLTIASNEPGTVAGTWEALWKYLLKYLGSTKKEKEEGRARGMAMREGGEKERIKENKASIPRKSAQGIASPKLHAKHPFYVSTVETLPI